MTVDWLERVLFMSAPAEKQRELRKEGRLPRTLSPEESPIPPTYTIWQQCRKNDTLWWDGGLADQPHILMLDFDIYERVVRRYPELTAHGDFK